MDTQLRNPFAMRDGKIILIEDLAEHERGLKCQCKCPECDGDFIARLGDIKVHHFAHSKDACDEVLAYTNGLYRLIHQILSSGSPFYVPALAVAYSFPYGGALNEHNIDSYIKIVPDSYSAKNKRKKTISPGRFVTFDSAEIVCDDKNHMQAIELLYMNSRMAIKVMPPDTVCKTGAVTGHKDMATLVLDYTGDVEVIQASDSKAFQEYLLSGKLSKCWIQNPENQKNLSRTYCPERKGVSAISRTGKAQHRAAENIRTAAGRTTTHHRRTTGCPTRRTKTA